MSDEKISQAEKDEAAYFAERAKAGAAAAREQAETAAGPHTLFDVQEMELNFGPQHPSTHGVLRLVLKVDGEKILEAKPDVGYLHRGTEKLFETETYPMGIPHTDRLDYVAAATNNHAFCLAVEKLLGVEVPRRAQLVRVILDELQRLSSHLVWLGTSGIDLGAVTPFWYAFREREQILDFFEEYCGARLTLNCMRIGGLPLRSHVRLDRAHRRVHLGLSGAHRRLRAALDRQPDLEEAHGRRGRHLRGGVHRVGPDRTDHPGLGTAVGPAPGAALRVLRRARLRLSRRARTATPTTGTSSACRRCARALGSSASASTSSRRAEIRGKVPRVIKPPAEEIYASVESPKGELGFYCVSNGSNKPYRMHVRPPSLHQPAGAAAPGEGASRLGPRRVDRDDRHRAGRGRPMREAGYGMRDTG